MRFMPDGPSIPDELLNARDEGRVVFFCGAGVSRAKVDLPNFIDLTQKVIDRLGAGEDGPANKLLKADKRIREESGVSLSSIDRVFGLLEYDFHDDVIEAAVASALRPRFDPDLSAHHTLLQLAKTPEGHTRLVTTNFDRLFEACDESLHVWSPPKLPDLSSSNELNGIIHLHGVVDQGYKSSDGNGFVLSSSEFGHAYLADGWATDFIKSILEKYIVVFVGYAADDPPVRYLLEALNKRSQSFNMYTFHAGSIDEAQTAWASKGVKPIVCDEHEILWKSLELWTKRAQDPEAWKQEILDNAQDGPSTLEPFERGQVAHIVSTVDGMRLMAMRSDPLPAEWLCVFDSHLRYTRPTKVNIWDDSSEVIDPFERYGLDEDVYIADDGAQYNPQHEVPADAWDCFRLMDVDKQELLTQEHSAIAGYHARHVPTLSRRLSFLGDWIVNVAEHPILVWWVIKQGGLHSGIIEKIILRFRRLDDRIRVELWQDLSKIWNRRDGKHPFESHEMKETYRNRGWSKKSIYELAEYYKPVLEVDTFYIFDAFPPINENVENIYTALSFDIKYQIILDLEIPDRQLLFFIKRFRNVLEDSVYMQQTFSRWPTSIDSIYIESDENENIHYDEKLSAYIHYFVKLFSRLIDYDPMLAKKEYLAWDCSDDMAFARISLWLSGKRDVISGKEAGKVILDLSDELFWDPRAQRDLLITLCQRWNGYSMKSKKKIEKRLLKGRLKYKHEKKEYIKKRTWNVLERIQWLADQGCSFEFDLKIEIQRLMKFAPNWKQEYAEKADRSAQGRGGRVRHSYDHSDLLRISLKSVLSKAMDSMSNREELLLEHDPFTGLCEARPVRAFSALTIASKENKYPDWAWSKLLYANQEENTSTRFLTLIAERIARVPLENIKEISYPLVSWYRQISKRLWTCSPKSFDKVWDKFILLLTDYPETGESTRQTNQKHYNWVEHAGNSLQGNLAKLWMDMLPDDLQKGKGFSKTWIVYVEQLLHLPKDNHRFSLVVLAMHTDRLYSIDEEWTRKNILTFLDSSEEDRLAFFAGFLWNGRVPSIELFKIVKPYMLRLAKDSDDLEDGTKNLSGILLFEWGNIDLDSEERLVTNNEMRDILATSSEEFRLMGLWNLYRLVNKKDNDWETKTIELIKNVWPRHKKAKSAKVSAQLCYLAFSNRMIFPEIIEDVISLVKSSSIGRILLPELEVLEPSVIDEYPEKVLDLLFNVLSEDTVYWPYNVNEALEKIIEVNQALRSDYRLIELKRRWNVR